MTATTDNDCGTDLPARLNRIPVWSLPKTYLVVIGLGYFVTFYAITDIGFAMPAIAKQFQLSYSSRLFLALAIGLIGYVVGSFVIGTLALSVVVTGFSFFAGFIFIDLTGLAAGLIALAGPKATGRELESV